MSAYSIWQKIAEEVTIPGTEMIHFPHTSIDLTAVVSSVCFKLTALRTVWGSSIFHTDEDIFRIEALQAGCVEGKCLARGVIQTTLHVCLGLRLNFLLSWARCFFPLSMSTALAMTNGRLLSFVALPFPLCSSWEKARFPNDSVK